MVESFHGNSFLLFGTHEYTCFVHSLERQRWKYVRGDHELVESWVNDSGPTW